MLLLQFRERKLFCVQSWPISRLFSIATKPGSATLPFFGVRPVLVDNEGAVIEGPGEGNLCFAAPWPGISRTILADHERFEKTYYKPFPGYYFTGDGARRDQDGYYWITGRVDDLMNVSGHLLSTAEIESALAMHPQVVEAAVVAAEHQIKGHSPYAFVVLRKVGFLICYWALFITSLRRR
jgi:acetyl-CoA synthetase